VLQIHKDVAINEKQIQTLIILDLHLYGAVIGEIIKVAEHELTKRNAT
jgi:hypothetical protein